MTDQTVTLRITANADGTLRAVRQVSGELDRMGTEGAAGGAAAARGLKQTESGARQARSAVGSLVDSLKDLAAPVTGVAGAVMAARMADEYTNLSSKIRLVTSSEQELKSVREAVFQVAQQTRQDLGATANLYTRLARATADMGLSQQKLLGITTTINQAFVVSGATAQEAAAAIIQLSQGLASGVLRGEEFNSVAEQAPIIMDLLAKQLGVTRGELRKMAEEGQLTADVLIDALGNGAASVAAQFAQMDMTIGASFTLLRNALTKFVGQSSEASGAAATIAAAIAGLSENLNTVANILGVVVVGALARVAASAVMATGAMAGTAIAAQQVAVGMGLAATASGAAATAMGVLAAAGRGLMALLGGPVGVAIAGTTVAFIGLRAVTQTHEEMLQELSATQAENTRRTQETTEAYHQARTAMRAANPSIISDEIERNNALLLQARARMENAAEGATDFGFKVKLLAERQRELVSELEKVNPALVASMNTYTQVSGRVDDIIAQAQERLSQMRVQAARQAGGEAAAFSRALVEAAGGIENLRRMSGAQKDAILSTITAFQKQDAALKSNETAQRRSAVATRENADEQDRLDRIAADGTSAIEDLSQTLDDQARAMGGPAVAAAQDYRDALLRLLEIETKLQVAGKLGAAQVQQLADARSAAHDLYQQDLGDIEARSAESTGIVVGHQSELVDAAADAARDYERTWMQAADNVAYAFSDFVTGSIRSFSDLARQVKDIFRRMLADMIAQWMRSGITKMFGSLFGGGFLSGLAGMFGGGGSGAGTASLFAQRGAGIGAGLAGGSGIGSGLFGAAGTSTGGVLGASGASAAGFMGIPVVGWIIAGMMANDSMFQQGWRSTRSDTTLPNGATVSGGEGTNLAGRIATAGAVNILDSLLRRIGFNDRIASLISGSSVHARLFGRSAPRLTAAETTFDLNSRGAGGVRYQTLERGGLFRSDRRRWHGAGLGGDALDGARELFDALQDVMREAAASLRAEAPAMLAASLRIVQEFDKDGKVKGTKYLVEALGRSWEEATAEAAKARLSAEAIIKTVDAAIGAVQTASASAIAERWRGDAEQLLEGAQLLTAVATELRAARPLFDNAAGITERLVALTVSLQETGETLTQTFARVVSATRSYGAAVASIEQERLLAGLSGFQRALIEIRQQERGRLQQLQELARAAGNLQAREEDLAAVRQASVEAQQRLVESLRLELVDLAAELYGTPLSVIEDQIAQLGDMQRAADDAARSVRDFLDSLRQSDELSPLTDAQRRSEALESLRRAAASGDADGFRQQADNLLRLSRRLFASGTDFNADFNLVQELGGRFQGGNSAGQLAALEAERDALLERDRRAQRLVTAQTLAQGLADYARASGRSFGDAASGLGFSLQQLASDLGIGAEGLDTYLQSLQRDTNVLIETLEALPDRIARAMFDLLIAGPTTPTVPPPPGTGPGPGPGVIVDLGIGPVIPVYPIGPVRPPEAEIQARATHDLLRATNELLMDIKRASELTATGIQTTAKIQQRAMDKAVAGHPSTAYMGLPR